MNATPAIRPLATTLLPCPWCDATIELDDALDAPVVRCTTCATAIDLEPLVPTDQLPIAAAA